MDYKQLQIHYEKRLAEHGPNAKGMDWPNQEDLEVRFKTLLGVVEPANETVKLHDLGCGVGLMVDFINASHAYNYLEYSGSDVSEKMIEIASASHENTQFEQKDVLVNPFEENQFDYIVMNGVLTEKQQMTFEEMEAFAQLLIKSVFKSAKKGIAFNVMSSHVDWERDDLFHYPVDRLVAFLVKECSRHIKVDMSYGLYEYTTYVYKEPVR